MMICPVCGVTYATGKFCGRDGSTLVPDPPTESAETIQPLADPLSVPPAAPTPGGDAMTFGAAAMAIPPASLSPAPTAKGRRLPRAGVIVVVCVACVALAAGLTFAIPALMRQYGSSATADGSDSTGGEQVGSADVLTVTGTVPQSTDNIAIPPVPSDAPACPTAMNPVSWTNYSDGSVLVCGGDSTYSVTSSAGWTPTELDFAADGYTVAYSNGATVATSLDGVVVTVTQSGQSPVTYVAGESWSAWGTGAVFSQTPGDLPACPADSDAISLSTWDSGWLLVCGTSASAPTYLAYEDGSDQGDAASVTTSAGGYCGAAPAGMVCVYQAPAVVTIGAVQHSVATNYFAGMGSGGAGQGTGSYDVAAPQDTAQDQVRYLVDILNKSKAQRAAIGAASQDVMNCTNLSSAVSQINGIAKNRQDLVAALSSTPVDQIPGGVDIVAKLRVALQASIAADQGWAQWGKSQQTSGCSPNEPQSLKNLENNTVTPAKLAFCDAWKTQIAQTYGVHAFTRDEI